MTPEGYKAVVDALSKEYRHSDYEVLPKPQEGEDIEYLTVIRSAPTQQIVAGLVLASLGRANLLDSSEGDSQLPSLACFDIQYGSITFLDLNSKAIYEEPIKEDA